MAATALLEEHGDIIEAVALGSDFARRRLHHCSYCGKGFSKRNNWQRHTRSCDTHSADTAAVHFARRQCAAKNHVLHGIQPSRKTALQHSKKPTKPIVESSPENDEPHPSTAADCSPRNVESPKDIIIESVSDGQQDDAACNPVAAPPKPSSPHSQDDSAAESAHSSDSDDSATPSSPVCKLPLPSPPHWAKKLLTDRKAARKAEVEYHSVSGADSGLESYPESDGEFALQPGLQFGTELDLDLALGSDFESYADYDLGYNFESDLESDSLSLPPARSVSKGPHQPQDLETCLEKAIAAVQAALVSSKLMCDEHRPFMEWSERRLPFHLQRLILNLPPEARPLFFGDIYHVISRALVASGHKTDAMVVSKEMQSFVGTHVDSDPKKLRDLKALVSDLLESQNRVSIHSELQTPLSWFLLQLAAAKYSTKIAVMNTVPSPSFDGLLSIFDQNGEQIKTDSLADFRPSSVDFIVMLTHGDSSIFVPRNQYDSSNAFIYPSAASTLHASTFSSLFLWWRFLGLLHSLSEQKLLLESCDDILHELTPGLMLSDARFSFPMDEFYELARHRGWLQPISAALCLHPWMRVIESVDVEFDTVRSIFTYLKKNTAKNHSKKRLENEFRALVLQNHGWSHPEATPTKRFTLNVFNHLIAVVRERKQTQN